MYGSAESVAGDLASERRVRDSRFLATKVCTTGREAGIKRMEMSFKRLHTTMIDLMQVHNLVESKIRLETIRAWQEAGRIRYSGITRYSTSAFGEIDQLMKAEKPDFVQICYSIVTRETEKRLLPLAADLGIGVVVNRPFEASGLFNVAGEEASAMGSGLRVHELAAVFPRSTSSPIPQSPASSPRWQILPIFRTI